MPPPVIGKTAPIRSVAVFWTAGAGSGSAAGAGLHLGGRRGLRRGGGGRLGRVVIVIAAGRGQRER